MELVPANETSEIMEDRATEALDVNSTNATNGTNATKMVKIMVERERKRLHYTTLKAVKEHLGAVRPITSAHIAECIARNKKLLDDEKLRRLNAEAKNALESFIIDTRDKLSSDENVQKVSTEDERAIVSSEFETVEEWLYEDGVSLEAKAYQLKKKGLEKLTFPIFLRLSELEARPRVMAQAQEAINWTLTILETWAAERPEVTAEERAKVLEMCSNFTTWLDEVSVKQDSLLPHEEPAFLSTQVRPRRKASGCLHFFFGFLAPTSHPVTPACHSTPRLNTKFAPLGGLFSPYLNCTDHCKTRAN